MSERREGTDEQQEPWLLTQETPGLDPEPIRQQAGPDWPPDAGSHVEGEAIDDADVETGDADEQRGG